MVHDMPGSLPSPLAVNNNGGVHLYAYAQPSTAQAQAPLLPWNTTLTVDAYLPPDAAHQDQAGWCDGTTPSGQRGYVNSGYLDYDLPDPQAKLLKIQAHDTAETIVKKAGYRVAHGRDARYYVNVLVYVNKPGTLYNPDPHPEQVDHWKKTVAVVNETIWLPGQAFADSLTGVVGSGSITGGAWATLQQGLGWAEVHVLQTASVLAQPVALVADAATGAAHYALTVGGRVMGPFVGPAVHEAAALVGGTMTVISAATSNPAAMLHALVGLATAPARVLAAIPGAFVGLLQEQGKALLGSLLGTQVRDELGDTIGAILKDPLTFARNLATAVGVGFHGLLTHLGTHFLSDALGWLVGKSGLTIPSGLGAAETMLAVAQQVVGLGEAHLTDLLVKALVKRGTSEPQARTMVRRAEGVIGTLGTVLTHLPQSAGEAGHLVTQALASLGGLVQSQIQRWLLQTMVTQAIARLVALCNPGVGLVLQAVQGIYTAVQTFLQYKDALGALLGQVVSTFRGLTTTSPAAVAAVGGKIRDLLVGLIPAALTFLMRYFGLDGLAQKIHDVLGTVRAKIDAVVGAIMERLVGLVRSVAGRIGGARGSTTGTPATGHAPPAPTHQENPTHEAIAQAIVTKLEHLDGAPKDFAATRTEKEGEARPLKARYQPQLEKGINLSITFATTPDDAGGKETLDFTVVIAPNTTKLSGRILVAPPGTAPTHVTYQTLSGSRAHWVHALPLTLAPGNTKGSAPYQNPPGWGQVVIFDHDIINDKRTPAVYGPLYWKQLHLLSEMFHGPGKVWNLMPGRGTDNDWMTGHPEQDVKSAFGAEPHATLSYRTEATYFAASDGDNNPANAARRVTFENFVKSIHIEWFHVRNEHGAWVKDTSRPTRTYEHSMIRPPFLLPPPNTIPAININATGWEGLSDRLDLGPGLAQNIVKVRNGKLYLAPGATEGRFIDWADFLRRMTVFYAPKGIDFVHRDDLWPTINKLVRQQKVTL